MWKTFHRLMPQGKSCRLTIFRYRKRCLALKELKIRKLSEMSMENNIWMCSSDFVNSGVHIFFSLNLGGHLQISDKGCFALKPFTRLALSEKWTSIWFKVADRMLYLHSQDLVWHMFNISILEQEHIKYYCLLSNKLIWNKLLWQQFDAAVITKEIEETKNLPTR